MSEYWMIWCMTAGGALFALGGTGYKWARRYVLPVAIALPMAFIAHIWPILAYTLFLSIALHMGYGDRSNYFKRFVIFCGYSFPCLFLGFSWWILATPVLCLVLFALSNSQRTERMFFWKFIELTYGVLIAVTLISTGGNLWK